MLQVNFEPLCAIFFPETSVRSVSGWTSTDQAVNQTFFSILHTDVSGKKKKKKQTVIYN